MKKITYHLLKQLHYFINIDTFFFKCKEWANNQKICVLSGLDDDMETYFCFIDNNNNTIQAQFNSDSEQQAVIDATQWVLKNKIKG